MKITKRKAQAMETRETIFQAALDLMSQIGYEKMTIRTICQKANVSTGAFYHHFSSKEEVLKEIFRTYDDSLAEFLTTYSEDDPIEAIRSITLSLTGYILDYGAPIAKELYISQLTTKNNYIVKGDRLYYQTIIQYTEKAIEQGLIHSKHSAEYIAEYLIRINRGVIIDWCLHDYSYDLLRQAEEDLNFVLQAFTTESN